MQTEIHFQFNIEKTIEVAAMFLELHGGKMKYLGLLKLLYITDRFALERIEKTLTGDEYVSMEFGPVLSKVYDLIKGEKKFQSNETVDLWSKFFLTNQQEYTIKLKKYPKSGELSEEEEEIINKVYENCGKCNRFDLVEIIHEEFPEWQNPKAMNPPRKVNPINVVDILKNVGKSSEEIEYISEIAARETFLDKVLSR